MKFNFEIETNLAQSAPRESKLKQTKVDSLGRSYGTGKRKNAVARVWLKLGKGKITVNSKDIKDYFPFSKYQVIINQPFVVASVTGKYDVVCTVTGGGTAAQADAITHGVSKALSVFNPEAYHLLLRTAGLLTRDDRIVERKKYGRKKARKRFQFSKR